MKHYPLSTPRSRHIGKCVARGSKKAMIDECYNDPVTRDFILKKTVDFSMLKSGTCVLIKLNPSYKEGMVRILRILSGTMLWMKSRHMH